MNEIPKDGDDSPLPLHDGGIVDARELVTAALAGNWDLALLLACGNPPMQGNMQRSIGHLLLLVEALISGWAESQDLDPQALWVALCRKMAQGPQDANGG